MQVFAEADGTSRLVWITDLLPDEAAATFGPVMRAGAEAMRTTLEAVPTAGRTRS
jgi:hypothetical protein